MSVRRKPVIGVMGGSKATESVAQTAHRLGALIAEQGWILLNGGRNTGVMAASAAGAKEAGGTVIGILPDTTRAKASADLDIAVVAGIGSRRLPGAWPLPAGCCTRCRARTVDRRWPSPISAGFFGGGRAL